MSRTSLPVVLSDAEMIRLEQWIRAGSTPQQVVLRAQIVRGAAEGAVRRGNGRAHWGFVGRPPRCAPTGA